MKRTIKNLLFVLTICSCTLTSSGQQSEIDSLSCLLKTAKHDTVKIRLRAEIGEEMPVLRITYWDSIRVDAEKWDLKKFIAEALNNIGYICDNHGEISKALEYYNEGLKIREEIGDKHGIAESLNNIGFDFEKLGDIPRALENDHKGLKIQEEINDKQGIALSLNNIARIYEEQNDIPKALENYQKSLKLGEDFNKKDIIATELNNIGLIYRDQAQRRAISDRNGKDSLLNKSLEYFGRSLNFFKELNDSSSIATMLQNIGTIYGDKKDHSKAMEYFNISLDLRKK